MTFKMDVRWKHPFSAIVAGPSNCGKSFFVKNLLDNAQHVLSSMPENILYCYSVWQKLYDEILCKYPFVKFIEGLPETLNDDQLLPSNKVNMVIVDDLMDSACENAEIERAFTKYVHHLNLSILFITQNIFFRGKSNRTISLNTKYLVLFKNPRDKLQIATLARQMYPGKTQFFLEAFQDATQNPYGYLIVDLNASTPDAYRLRTGLFPPEWPVVYVLKAKQAHTGYKRKRGAP